MVRVDRSVGLLLDLTFGERHCPAFVHVRTFCYFFVEEVWFMHGRTAFESVFPLLRYQTFLKNELKSLRKSTRWAQK